MHFFCFLQAEDGIRYLVRSRGLGDVYKRQGWTYGSLVPPQTPAEPPGLDDGTAAALLDEAEDFINSVGPQVMAEVQAERNRRAGHPSGPPSLRRRIFRRRSD